MSRSRRFSLLAAVMALALPVSTLAEDPAAHIPADTMLYIGWDSIVDDTNVGILRAIPALLVLSEWPEGEEMIAEALPLLEAALRGDGAVLMLDFEWGNGPSPLMALVSHGPGKEIMAKIDELHGTANEEAVGGVTVRTTGEFSWGLHKDTFFFCHAEAADRIVDALVDPAKALLKNEAFRTARGQARVPARNDWHFTIYKNIPRLVSRLKEVSDAAGDPAPDEFWKVIEELGINQMTSGLLHITGEGDYSVSRIFVGYEGEPRGLLKLWEQQAVTGKDLNRIPADAYWGSVCNFDLEGVYAEVMRIIEEVEPDMIEDIEGGDAMAASMIGFSPTRDLLPIFGDTWIWHDAPANGGFIFTGATVQIETDDAEGMRAIFARLMQIAAPVAASQNVGFDIGVTEHNGHKIEYLSLPGQPMPIAPAVAYHSDFAVVGLSPQTVKVVLDHLDSPGKRGGLASHPDVEAVQSKLGGDLQALYYTDARYVTQMTYGLVHLGQTMVASLARADVGALPTLGEVLAKMGSTVGGCRRVEGGALYQSFGKGGFPVAISSEVVLLGVGGAMVIPAISQAREEARQVVSMSNLRGIGVGCHIYANDNNGDFPNSIEELLVGGQIPAEILVAPHDYQDAVDDAELEELRRQGFLTKENPGEGIIRTSYNLVTGQTMNNNVNNVLAYEHTYLGDQTSVLFIDGHVERMDWFNLRIKMQETYERLGRADELPGEFE